MCRIDGDTVHISPRPPPVAASELLDDLEELRGFAVGLGVKQRAQQL
ncbi:hypothetical protein ACFT7U_03535 [Streptomyces rochei]